MPKFSQANSTMRLTTPLPADALLITGLTVREGLSQLFLMQIDALAENATSIPFDQLLGQKVAVEMILPGNKSRFFNGTVIRVGQGGRDQDLTTYRLEVAPQAWLLTRRWQSRIFQQITVPDILKKVLTGIDVAYEIQGTFQPRDYCVQYRESDFNFASRLMEEEGIYYFFKHTKDGHKMVLANTPQSHPDVPEQNKVIFEGTLGGTRDDLRIITWGKTQELRSGKYTLWDHTFELPHKHLEAEKQIADSVTAGTVTHKLKVANNDKLEIYDWPGEYAQRFDGIDRSGGDRAADLQKIFDDNKRTVGIRMDQETVPGLVIQGSGNCRQFVSGYKFTLDRHFNANGPYVLTGVTHVARQGDFLASRGGPFEYSNTFSCIPFAQPFRPQRTALKPVIQGTQTAVVVGPKGEEIFTDRHGRVKVQFHWDREGKSDANSSCWVRVTQPWAGKRWGAFFIPRIGQEIIVDFLEGDPDQPIGVGCVYNPDQPHPYLGDGPDTNHMSNHKQDPKVCGVKSNTTPGGVGFNEWRFDDTKGKEQVFIHAQRDKDLWVNNDRREAIGHDTHLIVGGKDKNGKKCGDQREMIWQDRHQTVHRHHLEQVMGNVQYQVGHGDADEPCGNVNIVIEKDKKELIEKNSHLHVKENKNTVVDKTYNVVTGDMAVLINNGSDLHVTKDQKTKVDGIQSLIVGGDQKAKVTGAASLEVVGDQKEKVGGAVAGNRDQARHQGRDGLRAGSGADDLHPRRHESRDRGRDATIPQRSGRVHRHRPVRGGDPRDDGHDQQRRCGRQRHGPVPVPAGRPGRGEGRGFRGRCGSCSADGARRGRQCPERSEVLSELRGADHAPGRARRRHAHLPDGHRHRSPRRRTDPAAGLPDGTDRQHAGRPSERHAHLRRPAGRYCQRVAHGPHRQPDGSPYGRPHRPRRRHHPRLADSADRRCRIGGDRRRGQSDQQRRELRQHHRRRRRPAHRNKSERNGPRRAGWQLGTNRRPDGHDGPMGPYDAGRVRRRSKGWRRNHRRHRHQIRQRHGVSRRDHDQRQRPSDDRRGPGLGTRQPEGS